ncbi:GGDEF domain-containing protein [Klenkia brasiliensis]|uniref:Diguanylate cyclase (GGDEF) domain-containing protein n=1 Tax=Klenkia brasiliensis TaxID=333142 RepID=A0A1G7PBI3_9ACTN|nr:GGDEF domain-containing protein [Klenkia brasiliensis]SDF83638.1 diguanylate cyclase (GGDEF) domain-containing protein [Klenkia brasiliensis]
MRHAPRLDDGAARRLRTRARAGGRALSAGAVAVYPLWSFFDRALEPAPLAAAFTTLRLAGTVPMALLAVLLWATPMGLRRPAEITAAVLAVVQLSVGWMLPQVGHLELYLLGATLVLYACGAVLSASPVWTLLLVGATAVGYLAGCVTAGAVDADGLVATVCYLGSAAGVATIGHALRWRAIRAEVHWRSELEAERATTLELVAELRRLSTQDSLTGLANRRSWDDHLQRACERATESAPVSVALIDVDHFKAVNDTRGHDGGDRVLQRIAGILGRTVRTDDLAARLGGDELALLLPATGPVQAQLVAQRVRREVELFAAGGVGDPVTVSVGVAVGCAGTRPEELLRAADSHLYEAKRLRNAVVVRGGPTAGAPVSVG